MDALRPVELRLLPPFAVGRLGSSLEPMDNYDVQTLDASLHRSLAPAETLMVSPTTGEIVAAVIPERVRFRDELGRVRPVAPFFEVWARFPDQDALVPLTVNHLSAAGVTPEQVEWRVMVANHKAYRRTGDAADKIEADTGWFGGHDVKPLIGRCANFLPNASLPFGNVQFIRPNPAFPELRMRFIPAAGYVYGSRRPGEIGKDRNVKEVIYNALKGHWRDFTENVDDPRSTNPNETFALATVENRDACLGYLDDECDGIIEMRLTFPAQDGTQSSPLTTSPLTTFARIAVGPPTFVPDAFPIRTAADELEQALCGIEVSPEMTLEDTRRDAAEIVRRAVETVSLINTVVLNQSEGAGYSMAMMDNLVYKRALEPIMSQTVVDTLALQTRHQLILAALQSTSFLWFMRMLRRYDEVGNLGTEMRRKMPAMMRGADGCYLALTRRQYATVFRASVVDVATLIPVGSEPLPANEEPSHE